MSEHDKQTKLPPGHITLNQAANILGIQPKSLASKIRRPNDPVRGIKLVLNGRLSWVVEKATLDPCRAKVEPAAADYPTIDLDIRRPKRGKPGDGVLPPSMGWLMERAV